MIWTEEHQATLMSLKGKNCPGTNCYQTAHCQTSLQLGEKNVKLDFLDENVEAIQKGCSEVKPISWTQKNMKSSP